MSDPTATTKAPCDPAPHCGCYNDLGRCCDCGARRPEHTPVDKAANALQRAQDLYENRERVNRAALFAVRREIEDARDALPRLEDACDGQARAWRDLGRAKRLLDRVEGVIASSRQEPATR